jgi:hypothetical protein
MWPCDCTPDFNSDLQTAYITIKWLRIVKLYRCIPSALFLGLLSAMQLILLSLVAETGQTENLPRPMAMLVPGEIATQNSNVWSIAVYHKIQRLFIKRFSISTQVLAKAMNLQCLYPRLAALLKYRSITQNCYPLGRTISPLPPFRSTPSLTFNIQITR